MSTEETEKKIMEGALELLKKAEAKIEKIGNMLRIRVPEDFVEKFRGDVITYLDATEVKRALKDDFKECAGSVAVIPWALRKAIRALEAGNESEAESFLTIASVSANYASVACGVPDFKNISKMIIESESINDELLEKTMNELVKIAGVEV